MAQRAELISSYALAVRAACTRPNRLSLDLHRQNMLLLVLLLPQARCTILVFGVCATSRP